ncbi:MAG TPA: hypothetical protein VKV95_24165 [Terriglobia bacterium]|nr:hypothetical protein [Terriglobia bacterium]
MPSMSFSLPPPETESEIQLPRRPWASHIPWELLAVLLASGVYLAFFYRIPPSTTDEGMIAVGAERILRGQIPYRDFFSELGPGSFYIQAAIFHLGGISVSSFRITAWVLGVFLNGLIYILGKYIIRGPASFVPPLLFITTCYSFLLSVNHHWWGDFFFLLNLVCLAVSTFVSIKGGSFFKRILLLGAGALAAVTLLFMQPKGVWAILVGVTFLILVEMLVEQPTWLPALRAGLGKTSWFLIGAGSTLAMAAVYLGFHGALEAWVYDNFTFLFTNYLPYETTPGVYSWARVTHDFRWMVQEFSFRNLLYVVGFYFFSIVAPGIGFVGAIWQIKNFRVANPLRARLLLLFLLAGLGSLASELHEPNYLHLIWASPLILILFVDAMNEAFRRKRRLHIPVAVAAAIAIALVIAVAGRRVMRMGVTKVPVRTRRGMIFMEPENATPYQEWIDTIERDVPAGGETFIFPYDAQFYFLTATRNPTKYDVLLSDFHSTRQFEEAISSLQSRQPGYVFSFSHFVRLAPRAHFFNDLPDLKGPDAMEKSLLAPQSPYRLAETVEDMEVWVLKK